MIFSWFSLLVLQESFRTRLSRLNTSLHYYFNLVSPFDPTLNSDLPAPRLTTSLRVSLPQTTSAHNSTESPGSPFKALSTSLARRAISTSQGCDISLAFRSQLLTPPLNKSILTVPLKKSLSASASASLSWSWKNKIPMDGLTGWRLLMARRFVNTLSSLYFTNQQPSAISWYRRVCSPLKTLKQSSSLIAASSALWPDSCIHSRKVSLRSLLLLFISPRKYITYKNPQGS